METVGQETCRLCEGQVSYIYTLTVLAKHEIQYFQCSVCGSVQTQNPHWLNEAYSTNLASLDTGAAQRSITNLGAVKIVASILGYRDILDFGGGDGFLCRLLRDYSLNCFSTDKIAFASYAQNFTKPNFKRPDLLLAFEVLEHFSNPKIELAQLFISRPRAVLATTELYSGQGKNWWYLTPESGQHIFFYSFEAICMIAQKYEYRLHRAGSYFLFVEKKERNLFREIVSIALMNRIIIRLTRAILVAMPAPGVWRDFEAIRRNLH